MRDATERETVKTKRDENTAAAAATATRARPSIGSVCVLFRGARQTPYLDFARRDRPPDPYFKQHHSAL